MIVRKIIQFNTFQIITVSKMLPFAFEKSTPKEENITSTQQNLLARILMLTLQNQRLTKLHNNAQYNSKEYSFSNHSSNEISSNQFKLQMELKKIETDNLTIQINELQQKCIVQESKIHEQQNAYYVYQTTIKDETTQIKAQLQLYKNKYEEELLQRNQYQKKTIQLQKFINQYKQREQELIQKTNAFRNQQNNLVRIKQKSIDELEKKIKELKKELAVLKQNCIQKEQECFELRQNLKDAPKIEELNRWILKVRQYEEKQLQSCGKISQMSQQICGLKEKNRKLQHQYKQMLKIKQELQQSVTASRQNEDSMTVYFQRLSTYEKVIRDLQEEVKTLQNSNKIMQTKCNEKLVALEQQKNNAVTQWQAIVQEMNKQRSLLHAMQNQLDQYTNIKQNIMVKASQPPSQMETSSRIIETKMTDVSGKQSFISKYPSLENTNRLSREEGRVNSHKIIYHSDRINHSFSRLQTQNSQNCNDSFSKESGCRDCQSRGKVARSISSGRVPYQQNFRDQKQQKLILKDRENNLAINDSKQLLLDKLNYLKPQQDRLRITQRSLYSMHNKNMRHINNSYHSNIGNIFKNQPSSKLAISKPKEVATQKQNMNDMVFRKYSHLINRI